MKKIWELDPLAFEKMLDWLDTDRETAGRKYETIRLRLIKVLQYRRCPDGEELADVVFDRVARKIDYLAENYRGDPAFYFLNVANKVYLESLRKPVTVEITPDIPERNSSHDNGADDIRPEYECLKKCLAELTDEKRELIVRYYSGEKKEKKEIHRRIAEKAGIEAATLHVRTHRLRVILQKCVLKCIEEKEISEH